MLWCLTRSSSSRDDVITHLGGGEHLTWRSEPVPSGEGGWCYPYGVLSWVPQLGEGWEKDEIPTSGAARPLTGWDSHCLGVLCKCNVCTLSFCIFEAKD